MKSHLPMNMFRIHYKCSFESFLYTNFHLEIGIRQIRASGLHAIRLDKSNRLRHSVLNGEVAK